MNIDLRCLSTGLLILTVLGVATALPMDLFEPEDEEEFALEDKRNQPNQLYKSLYPVLPPRDARTRKTWRSKPYDRLSLVDDSVTKFDSQISVSSTSFISQNVGRSVLADTERGYKIIFWVF